MKDRAKYEANEQHPYTEEELEEKFYKAEMSLIHDFAWAFGIFFAICVIGFLFF